jgi:hypothetical protein
VYISRCLRKILNIKWPKIVTHKGLRNTTTQIPVTEQIKKGSGNGNTLRKSQEAIERTDFIGIPR